MSKIYFFNGWAMDQNLLSPLKNSTEYEIKVINSPYNIDKTSIDKGDIFIAYSFGVYYLNKFLSESQDLVYEKAIAINGLPETIGKFGINEKMFNMTLETLDKENLEKFLLNMDIDKALEDLIKLWKKLNMNYNILRTIIRLLQIISISTI